MPKKTNHSLAGVGHNSNGLDHDKLKELVARIEHLESEISDLSEDRKAIYGEAKASGIDPKALKAVIALRKKDKAEVDELQATIDEYLSALQGLADLPLGQAAIRAAGLAPPV
jgi:uncharacterized protein (UPF0335 family)